MGLGSIISPTRPDDRGFTHRHQWSPLYGAVTALCDTSRTDARAKILRRWRLPSTSTSATAAHPRGGSSGRPFAKRRRSGRHAVPRPAVESPWWRTAPNPTYTEGESFAKARDLVAKLKGDSYVRRAEEALRDSLGDRLTREAIWRW